LRLKDRFKEALRAAILSGVCAVALFTPCLVGNPRLPVKHAPGLWTAPGALGFLLGGVIGFLTPSPPQSACPSNRNRPES
jgi:hypothetical protein